MGLYSLYDCMMRARAEPKRPRDRLTAWINALMP